MMQDLYNCNKSPTPMPNDQIETIVVSDDERIEEGDNYQHPSIGPLDDEIKVEKLFR